MALTGLSQTSIAASTVSLVVSAAFLAAVPFRLYALRNDHVKIQVNWLAYLKLVRHEDSVLPQARNARLSLRNKRSLLRR